MKTKPKLVRIICAAELPACSCCHEPWCPTHRRHYADCPCLGPSEAEDLGLKTTLRKGLLYARLP